MAGNIGDVVVVKVFVVFPFQSLSCKIIVVQSSPPENQKGNIGRIEGCYGAAVILIVLVIILVIFIR